MTVSYKILQNHIQWHHIQQRRHEAWSREKTRKQRDAPVRCTTTTVISRHAKLHATIHSTPFTSLFGDLLKKNQVFYWDDNKNTAFQKLKNHSPLRFTAPLQCSKRGLPDIIQAHASQHGLGTCLVLNGKPIVFILKSQTDAETQYANIKK